MNRTSVLPRLMEYAGKYKVTMVLSWIFSTCSEILSLGPYICIFLVARELVDTEGNLLTLADATMARYGWLAVNLTIGSFMLYGIGLLCSHWTAFNLAANLRKIIEKNADNTENFIAHQLPDLAQAIVTPVAFLASMFYFDWKLALICLLPIAAGFAFLRSMLHSESDVLLENYQKALGDMSNAAVEYVRGISVVKVFGQTVHSFQRFHMAITTYRKFVTDYALSMEKPMSGYIAAVHGLFFVLVPAGIILYQLSQGVESFVLSFIFFVVFTPMVSVVLMRVMFSSSNQLITTQALDTIENLLAEKPLPRTAQPQKPASYDIVFDSVSFRYEQEGAAVVDGLSFTAPASTVTALVGPSGGGKTTVANLISRFWDVEAGGIRVGGVDVRDMDPQEWSGQISFVFQDVNLFKMTVAQNVAFSKPGATEEELRNALSLAQCDDILAKLSDGMHIVIGAKGIYLSGGEMQRIALARAILKDAPVLLLDEATAFADPENEYRIQKALEKLMQGKTVIMIAHRLSTVTGADQIMVLEEGRLAETGTHPDLLIIAHRLRSVENCDQIIVLREGRIAETGRHRELMDLNGLYRHLVELQRASAVWEVGAARQV